MDTVLVRLKAFDPRRGQVLRRFSYGGVRFDSGRGWYRVPPEPAEYLRGVRQVDTDPHSPLAFNVATEEEARRIDADEAASVRPTRATDDIPLSVPRASGGGVSTSDLPDGGVLGGAESPGVARRGRKAQE